MLDFPWPCQVTHQIRSFTFGNPSSARPPPSAHPPVRQSANLSIRPPVRTQSARPPPVRPRPPICQSASPPTRPPVRAQSTRPPPIRPRPPVRQTLVRQSANPSACPPVRRSPPVRPPSTPFASSKNYLPVSSGPKFFISCTPREIATSTIRGASRSHSGIRVSKLPPLRGNPRLTLLCRDREVRHDPSCRDVMTPS